MNKILYFLILITIFSCDYTEKEYNNPTEFLEENEKYFTEKYFNGYFKKIAPEIGELKFKIESTQELVINKRKFWGLKISAVGKTSWSYQEKCVLINNKGKIIFEKDFIQIEPELRIPECGVAEYTIKKLERGLDQNKETLHILVNEHYEPCANQNEINNSIELIYSIKNQELMK